MARSARSAAVTSGATCRWRDRRRNPVLTCLSACRIPGVFSSAQGGSGCFPDGPTCRSAGAHDVPEVGREATPPSPEKVNRPPTSREPPRSRPAGAGADAFARTRTLFRKTAAKSANSSPGARRCYEKPGKGASAKGVSTTIWGISTTLAHIVARRFSSSADALFLLYEIWRQSPPLRSRKAAHPRSRHSRTPASPSARCTTTIDAIVTFLAPMS